MGKLSEFYILDNIPLMGQYVGVLAQYDKMSSFIPREDLSDPKRPSDSRLRELKKENCDFLADDVRNRSKTQSKLGKLQVQS